ncbi:hypothetical protein GCM10025869_03760 [Homoserinibacter gongjuensis]|uniref:SecA Wing/Scaffold domain-containing protein n=1 Tax=Homoserinibacter gongjuensis TaxID=1162968 RepID=A0ABQ6JNH0_9MICO|nr:hypothetical protein GCM10025869_03760 [Homoserinibacter gongjuensis]
MRELERRVVLSVIDRRWRDHLYEMDYLKDGIGLRAMAQRDPLVEYQREGFSLYQSMMEAIREETVGFLYNLEVEVTSGDGQARVAAKGLGASTAPQQGLSYSAPSDDVSGGVEVRNQRGQVERAATARAQQAAARQAQGQAQQGGGERGAFGQRVDGDGAGQQAPQPCPAASAGASRPLRPLVGVRRAGATARGSRWRATVGRVLEPDRDGARAHPAVHDDDRLDDAVARFAHRHIAERDDGSRRGAPRGLTRLRRHHDALEQLRVDAVVDPAGDLLEIAGARDDLDDAAREILEQRPGIG